MKFPESALAHKYLDGLKGLEIGGSAHNAFGLNTLNVDNSNDLTNAFKQEEIRICGEALPVDIVAPGDELPFPDKSWDFIISSHVIEHFYRPIKALREWKRVAREYVFIIVPHVDRTFDAGRAVTTLDDLIARETDGQNPPDAHHSVWRLPDFLEICKYVGFKLVEAQDPDDKVGNGFAVVCKT